MGILLLRRGLCLAQHEGEEGDFLVAPQILPHPSHASLAPRQQLPAGNLVVIFWRRTPGPRTMFTYLRDPWGFA